MRRRRLARGAGVLLIGTLATAGAAFAAGPEVLPDALWWGARAATPLGETPLILARDPAGLSIESAWWPLYRGGHGERIEGESHRLRLATRPGRLRGGLELLYDRRVIEAGSGGFALDARALPGARGTMAFAWSGSRLDAAVAFTLRERQAPGWALGAVARPVPGWESEWRAASVSDQGVLGVRWNDEAVSARGDWTDHTLGWTLRGAAERGSAELDLLSIDRGGAPDAARDHAEPALAWREVSGALACRAAGFELAASGWNGAGRQSTTITRDGTRYADAKGPVRNAGLSLAVGARGSARRVRVWRGRWTGDAAGTLAFWPFQSLAGALGTREVAHSQAELAHIGLALERDPPARAGLGWGLALWNVTPSARYQSWMAPLFGIGRDGYQEGDTSLRSVLLAGLRLAPTVTWGGLTARLELVQWLPVRVTRDAARGPVDEGGGSPGSSASGGDAPVTRGGTVVRWTLER